MAEEDIEDDDAVAQLEPEENEEEPEGESEDSEAEGEAEEGDDAEGDEGGVEESSADRRARRTQTLANRTRDAELENARLKGELEALKKPAAAADTSESTRVRAEKLALMTPEERRTFELSEEIERLKTGQALTSLQIADATDRSRYEALATVNPVYKKHAQRVEETLADMRRKGTNAPREEVLAWILGKAALTAKPAKRVAADRAAAAERTKAVSGRPVSGRGDGGARKKGEGESLTDLEERLKGVQI